MYQINTKRNEVIEPDWLIPNTQNIPKVLQKQPWGVWRAEAKIKDGQFTGKWNKAPRNPLTGFNIPTSQPEKFSTFKESVRAYEAGQFTGIGVLMTGTGIVGFDIDDIDTLFKLRSDIKSWIDDAIAQGVYCEKSPSNKGLRLFVYGKLDGGGRKNAGLEIYDDVRFLTVTGHTYPAESKRIELIYGQSLIQQFLKLLDENKAINNKFNFQSDLNGYIDIGNLPSEIKKKLPEIFEWEPPENDWAKKLFEGVISMHNEDHSSADLAFAGYLAKKGLTPHEVDHVFRVSKLFRPKWDEMRGENQTYGERTINKVFSGFTAALEQKPKEDIKKIVFSHPKIYHPIYHGEAMPPRRFIGPKIGNGIRLFPEKAVSSLVALGATGKTSLLLSIACHIAAGKDWNSHPLEKQKVVMLFCEEGQEEVNRKFSAIIDDWSNEEKSLAQSNLLLIPLVGVDARLTTISRNFYQGSGVTEELIAILHEFGLKDGLVILDHMQGFTAGDLNLSETATSICREANKIVQATGAAVVLAAHISKQNIKSEEIEQGFAVGSLAFENATRQMSGMITMPVKEARKYNLEDSRREYVRLSLAKNSYGAIDNGIWLKKILSKKYHTVVVKPVVLSTPVPVREDERIRLLLLDYISSHDHATRNQLDKLSGTKGRFKCSKEKLRAALEKLICTGKVISVKIDSIERAALGLPKQIKEVLRPVDEKESYKAADIASLNFTPADLDSFEDMT